MGNADGPGAARVDFFISYTAADQDVAEWIAWVLEDTGYQTVIQAWDFRPGREFVTEMQQALVRAERVLDSAPLEDAVTTQDTVTMLRGAIRGLVRVCPPALKAKVRAGL